SILIRFAARTESSRSTGEQPGRRGLSDRGRPVPARDELLDPISLDRLNDPPGDEVGLRDEVLEEAMAEARAVREARRVDQARVDRVHRDAAACKLHPDRPRDRELSVLRGAVATG